MLFFVLTLGLVATKSVLHKDSSKLATESLLLPYLEMKISQREVRKIVLTTDETEIMQKRANGFLRYL